MKVHHQGHPSQLARSATVAVAVILGGAILSSCDTPSTPSIAVATKHTADGRRTDIAPLASRLPQLGDAFTAEWYGGTLGDERNPGPSTFWVDALITVPAGTSVLTGSAALENTTTPEVFEDLTESLPACEWQRADPIDKSWGPSGWETHVWICAQRDQLVVTMVGGN